MNRLLFYCVPLALGEVDKWLFSDGQKQDKRVVPSPSTYRQIIAIMWMKTI